MWGILNSLGLAQKSGKSKFFMPCLGGCLHWHGISDQAPKVSREADVVMHASATKTCSFARAVLFLVRTWVVAAVLLEGRACMIVLHQMY